MTQDIAAPRSGFAPLVREMRRHRLLERRPVRYGAGIAADWLLGLALVAVVITVGDSWWQVLLAVPAAVISARSTFIGHDAGHQQIARSRHANRALGLLHGNLLVGMSYGWWVDKHNRHHANPNHTEKDPDVGAGALVWTPEQAAGRTGTALRWLTRHQAVLFFPMLLLEGINLKVSGVRALTQRPRREALVEGGLIAVHTVGYAALLLAVMAPGTALAFFLVHHAVLGLHLGCAFAPNHKGMPVPAAGERWDHLHKQVLTSRNVRGGPVVDWFLGGLNYQIEHHLFPSMPRPNLRRAQPLVRAHCADAGLPYTQAGLRESYVEVLRHLHAVGASLRGPFAGAGRS